MRRLFFVVLALAMLCFTGSAMAFEISGVNIPDTYQIDNNVLKLNGAGVRRKFIFVKIYVGALYVQKKTHDPEEVAKEPIKVIRMHFLYSHIPASKIKGAFADDLKRISKKLYKSEVAKRFLNIFNFDVKEGDNLDLIFYRDTLFVFYNGKKMGEVKSKDLVNAVLSIYIGKHPAQESLKKAMLGE